VITDRSSPALGCQRRRSYAIQFLSPLEIAYCCIVMVLSYAIASTPGWASSHSGAWSAARWSWAAWRS